MGVFARTSSVAACCTGLALALASSCRPAQTTSQEASTDTPVDAAAEAPTAIVDAAPTLAISDAAAEASSVAKAPTKLHMDTREELLSLFSIKDFTEQEKKNIRPEEYLKSVFNPKGPQWANQGNPAIAQHSISREKCLEGLKDIVIQTPEQKAKCGAENMVPVWTKGKDPWFCIDVFEFPNKPCELPVVWIMPPHAKKICELQGKRLCSDIEWNIACRGDPQGGDDWKYAYGSKYDLEICHTNLRHRTQCVVRDAKSTWESCTTDTEPSGAFPKCRSRFGVFDQHGNVAEVMMRRESPTSVVTQLKGSAWFYVELAREPGEPVPAETTNKTGAYPDHCNFDPRWHVEKLDEAMHVNYHLGFRCCKSIP